MLNDISVIVLGLRWNGCGRSVETDNNLWIFTSQLWQAIFKININDFPRLRFSFYELLYILNQIRIIVILLEV